MGGISGMGLEGSEQLAMHNHISIAPDWGCEVCIL